MSVSFRMEMVEDFTVFFRKVIPCLVQMNLKFLAFLNFRHSLKRCLFNLVRLSLMKIFSVWSRSLLRLLKIRSLTLLEQKRAMLVGRGCLYCVYSACERHLCHPFWCWRWVLWQCLLPVHRCFHAETRPGPWSQDIPFDHTVRDNWWPPGSLRWCSSVVEQFLGVPCFQTEAWPFHYQFAWGDFSCHHIVFQEILDFCIVHESLSLVLVVKILWTCCCCPSCLWACQAFQQYFPDHLATFSCFL